VSYASSISHALDTEMLHRSKDLEGKFLRFCGVAAEVPILRDMTLGHWANGF